MSARDEFGREVAAAFGHNSIDEMLTPEDRQKLRDDLAELAECRRRAASMSATMFVGGA